MLKFFVPILYSIETRYDRNRIKGILLYLAIYLIPQIVLMHCFAHDVDKLILAIAIILVNDLYEIGYIQNDAETIKKEKKPTMRLLTQELRFYERYKLLIYTLRLLIAMALSYVLLCHYDFSLYSIIMIIVLGLLLPIYYLYNSMRNAWNLLILTILTSYRYIMPLLLCVTSARIAIGAGIYAYLMYPLPTIIQQCVMGKFDVKIKLVGKLFISDIKDRYSFRVKYYLALSLLFLFTCLLYSNDIKWILLILPGYYLILRATLCLAVLMRDVQKER